MGANLTDTNEVQAPSELCTAPQTDAGTPRSRRHSITSSTSSLESDSSASSSNISIEDPQIQQIFLTRKNVSIRETGPDAEPPTPTFRLFFPGLPSVTREDRIWQHRNPGSLLLEDQLDPAAPPFTPRTVAQGGAGKANALSSPHQRPPRSSLDDSRLTTDLDLTDLTLPRTSEGQYIPPPGLPLPVHSAAPQTSRFNLFDDSEFDGQLTPRSWVNQHPIPPPPSARPSWFSHFATGIDPTADSHLRELSAQAAVASLPAWRDEDFAQLAQCLLWYVYLIGEDVSDGLGHFAACLFRAIEVSLGPISAQSFLWSMRQRALHAFMTSWNPAALDPSLYFPSQLTPHVIGSISLARFIADLFVHGLLAKVHVMSCLSKLLENMVTEEHVVAIGYLVVRSGAELWVPSTPQAVTHMRDFLYRFTKLAPLVRLTLLGREPGYSATWINAVTLRLTEWEACITQHYENGDPSSAYL